MVGSTTSIISNGGDIILAGSSQVSNGVPTGHAYTEAANDSGVSFGTSPAATDSSVINSTGTTSSGAIKIYGKSSTGTANSNGVVLGGGLTLNAGSNSITIDGITDSQQGNGIALQPGGSTKLVKILSASIAGTAISIAGTNTGSGAYTGAGGRGIGQYVYDGVTINATAGGNISVVGTTNMTTQTIPGAIRLYGADILASTGSVTVDGDKGVVFAANTTNLGSIATGTAASGAVNVIGDKNASAGTVNVRTTGDVSFLSKGASFTATFSIASFNVAAGANTLTIGKSGNTSDVTLSAGVVSTKSDITVYGAAITANASLTTTVDGNITMTGSGAYSGSGALNAKGSVNVTGTSFSTTGAITSAGTYGISIIATSGGATIGANLNAATASANVNISATGDRKSVV